MAWYDDKKKTTHVAHDKDVETAEREGREAAAKGWVVQETTRGTGVRRGGPGDHQGAVHGRDGTAQGASAQRRQGNDDLCPRAGAA